MGQEYVPAVDASGDGIGAKAAEANKRTAQLAKNPPGLGAPSAAPVAPAVPASETLPAVTETTSAPAVEAGTTPAPVPLATPAEPATPAGRPRFVSPTLTPSTPEATSTEPDPAVVDAGEAWLGQYDGDQAKANREAHETQKRASESAKETKALADENERLKADLEAARPEHPDEPALPETDEEISHQVEAVVAEDAECQRLATAYQSRVVEMNTLANCTKNGQPILSPATADREEEPVGGSIREHLDEIRANERLLKNDQFDEMQQETFKTEIRKHERALEKERQRFARLYNEGIRLGTEYGGRKKAFETNIRESVEATVAERLETDQEQRADAQIDSVFNELLPSVPPGDGPGQRDDINDRMINAAEAQRSLIGGPIEDLQGFLRAEFEALKPLWQHAIPVQRVEEARRRAEVAAQPAPLGNQAIAAAPVQPSGDARSRRKAADRRSSQATRTVSLVHR